jgi:hypothetical protein
MWPQPGTASHHHHLHLIIFDVVIDAPIVYTFLLYFYFWLILDPPSPVLCYLAAGYPGYGDPTQQPYVDPSAGFYGGLGAIPPVTGAWSLSIPSLLANFIFIFILNHLYFFLQHVDIF